MDTFSEIINQIEMQQVDIERKRFVLEREKPIYEFERGRKVQEDRIREVAEDQAMRKGEGVSAERMELGRL